MKWSDLLCGKVMKGNGFQHIFKIVVVGKKKHHLKVTDCTLNVTTVVLQGRYSLLLKL